MEQTNVKTKNIKSLFLFLCVLIIMLCLVSLGTGHLSISPYEIWQTLLGNGSERDVLLLFEFRLPRLVLALLVGVGLGLSGAIFQGVTQNRLADPGILGVNAGAGLAVVSYLYVTNRTSSVIGNWTVIGLPFSALVGGLTAAVLIYVLAWKDGVTPVRLILVGIGVNAGFGAALMILQLKMSDSDFNRATVWLSGSIWNAHWQAVWSVLPWILLLIPLALYKSKVLDILQLGDEVAIGLGTSVEKERVKLLFIAVALAAACVSVAGGIAFLGLGAPHLARRLVGGKHQRLLPITGFVGAILLLGSDILARTLLSPQEIPVGLVVSAIGAPYFMYLLMTVEE